MIENFAGLLTQDEVNNLIGKLQKYRELQCRECSMDEKLILISWARAIRRNDRLLNLLLMSDYMLDVDIEKCEVYKVNA